MNRGVLYGIVLSVVFLLQPAAQAGKGGGPPLPPPRDVPGITAEDSFPNACVDCHIYMKEQDHDVRLSTSMKTWAGQVDPQVLQKARGVAPRGLQLRGTHPVAPGWFADIPASCLGCHGKTSARAPELGRLLHVLHLTGGADNPFMTIFQGECTHCHKFNPATGAWSIPSAPEK
jgi:hypothetical protein